MTAGPDPRHASARAIRRALRAVPPRPGSFTPYADLRRCFTVRVACVAEWLVEPETREELLAWWQALREEGVGVRILGGGSNTIPVSPFLSGLTLSLRRLRRITVDPADPQAVQVDAGVPLARLCRAAETRGLAGLAGLSGIPGTVGGALVMNAGGRQGTIGDVVEEVEVLERDATARTLPAASAGFGYRQSSLTGRVVVGARLRLRPGDPVALRGERQEVVATKARVQPLAARSAGCFFQNPPDGQSAGLLLDQAGLKGSQVGGASSSRQHANFLVNLGGATGADFAALARRLRSRVAAVHGLTLKAEVKLWR